CSTLTLPPPACNNPDGRRQGTADVAHDPPDPVPAGLLQALAESIAGPALPLPSVLLGLCAHRRGPFRPLARRHAGHVAPAALPTLVRRRHGPRTGNVHIQTLPAP